jgi:hypothetical protein
MFRAQNVLLRATLRTSAFVTLVSGLVFSASVGYGLLRVLLRALANGADIGLSEFATHSGLTLVCFAVAGGCVFLAKEGFWRGRTTQRAA